MYADHPYFLLYISRWCRFSCRTRSPPKFELLILILSLSRSLAWCAWSARSMLFFPFCPFLRMKSSLPMLTFFSGAALSLASLSFFAFSLAISAFCFLLLSSWDFCSSALLAAFSLLAMSFFSLDVRTLSNPSLSSCLRGERLACSVPVKTICEVWLKSTILWAGEFRTVFQAICYFYTRVAIR